MLHFLKAVRIAREYGLICSEQEIEKMRAEAVRRSVEDGEMSAETLFCDMCDNYGE